VGKRTIYILTILILAIAVAQLTPLAFLQKDAADFVWGLAAGLGIGAIVTWFASRT
jgi:TctA family transporter